MISSILNLVKVPITKYLFFHSEISSFISGRDCLIICILSLSQLYSLSVFFNPISPTIPIWYSLVLIWSWIIKFSKYQISLGGKLESILSKNGATTNSVHTLPNAIERSWIVDKIMKNDKWETVDKKSELLDLIDNKCFLLREKYYNILKKNKYNISENQKKQIDQFLDQYEEDDKQILLDIINKTELVLINNS